MARRLRGRVRRGKPAPQSNIPGARTLEKKDLERVQTYMRRLFTNTQIRVVARPKKKDSAEVYLGEEFIGVLFEDKEDGDLSYNFQMAILDTDLED